jgi:aspartokinase-like uncharacterized kinase
MKLTVVKIGGSLYDMPGLAARLQTWLKTLAARRILLVPGGGPAADVIREYDRVHGLGEKAAHELALRSLTLNAWFLSELLGGLRVLDPLHADWDGLALLDAHAFCRHEEVSAQLPACWEATSDSIAAATALVLNALELVLLKSTDESAGLVDAVFPRLASRAPFAIRMVNFRV